MNRKNNRGMEYLTKSYECFKNAILVLKPTWDVLIHVLDGIVYLVFGLILCDKKEVASDINYYLIVSISKMYMLITKWYVVYVLDQYLVFICVFNNLFLFKILEIIGLKLIIIITLSLVHVLNRIKKLKREEDS